MSVGFQKAAIVTLSVHAAVLFILTQFSVADSVPASELYAEIEFLDADDLPEIEEKSFEQTLRDRLDEKVSNLRSDASADKSSESRSTGLNSEELATLEALVEAELAELENSEMERLASDEKSFETVGLPENSESGKTVDTMEDWDKQYDGRVTVKFNLSGRSPRHLDVPGYQCRGKADITVSIVVSLSGSVISAEILSGAPPESCFALAALRSALASEFLPSSQTSTSPSNTSSASSSASPRRQSGTLQYLFVAQ